MPTRWISADVTVDVRVGDVFVVTRIADRPAGRDHCHVVLERVPAPVTRGDDQTPEAATGALAPICDFGSTTEGVPEGPRRHMLGLTTPDALRPGSTIRRVHRPKTGWRVPYGPPFVVRVVTPDNRAGRRIGWRIYGQDRRYAALILPNGAMVEYEPRD